MRKWTGIASAAQLFWLGEALEEEDSANTRGRVTCTPVVMISPCLRSRIRFPAGVNVENPFYIDFSHDICGSVFVSDVRNTSAYFFA